MIITGANHYKANNLCFYLYRIILSVLYTAKNAADLMPTICIKLVDFIKLHQVCEHQTCCNLIFAGLLQVDEITFIKAACSSQLAASLLTTCNRLVIIKPEQAMRTHPDIGLVIGDLLRIARFWLCIPTLFSLKIQRSEGIPLLLLDYHKKKSESLDKA